ncbi:MAG: wax ester/triacylglycerol synthase family O-acyltransferase [Pseudomonadota bacterium]|nr:wax ester/triacylglycerol synthase family O-acyltransferase [Pseudomonadota bacterium]
MRTVNPYIRELMTKVDTAWWRMDSNDNLMVINGLLFFDEPMPRETFKELLEQRLVAKHSRFRQRPCSQHGIYYWEEVPELDMDYHLTDLPLTLAPDADPEAALRSAVSQLVPLPLDPERPLWRFYFLPHYQNGSAVLVRIHHSYADGIALISVLDAIADHSVLQTSPAARFKWPVRKPRSDALLHKLSFWLGSGVFYTGFAGAWLFEAMRVILCRPDTKTVYKRDLSPQKQVGWAPSLPVREVKQVGKALGCTLNDVILGCVAGSLRRYLERIGEPVAGVHVRATVPVNLRPLEQGLELGNRFGLVYLELPVGEPTVKRRIEAVRRNMKKLRSGVQAQMSYNVLAILGYFPLALQSWAMRFFSSKASAVITNVPGPTQPVVLMGRTLSKPMFWVPQSGGIGIGVSILTYNNKVEFGFVADAALVPDPKAMIDDYMAEFRAIQAEVMATTTPSAVLTEA